jgi:chromosome segregation ATPase
MNQSIWLAIASGLSMIVGGILQKIIDGLNKKKAEEYLIQERKKIAEEIKLQRVKLQEKVDKLEARVVELTNENTELQKDAIRLEYSYKFCLSQFRLLKKHYPELLADISDTQAEIEESTDDK